VNLSNVHFDPQLAYWQDYLPFLKHLEGSKFPVCDQLNNLLSAGLSSAGGHAIRFVPSERLDDGGYEYRIYTTGQVSTREKHWHDLFNAMVWMRFPRIKVAMNSLHFHAIPEEKEGRRGELRDALTLFDECGVIVASDSREMLSALAQRRWSELFLSDSFPDSVRVSICGHAMLEKYLSPYKSMTAKALLVQVGSDFLQLSRDEMLQCLDIEIAKRLLDGTILTRPAWLAPLPLAGVPGWWTQNEQNEPLFYEDLQVFRAPPRQLSPAPVMSLQLDSNQV
jgi:hypothetical protein